MKKLREAEVATPLLYLDFPRPRKADDSSTKWIGSRAPAVVISINTSGLLGLDDGTDTPDGASALIATKGRFEKMAPSLLMRCRFCCTVDGTMSSIAGQTDL